LRLLDDLRREHERIEPVLGSLQAYAAARASGTAGPEDAAAYLAFFRLYAGRYHHAREEEILLPALVERAELPADRGPIPSLLRQHHEMAQDLEAAAALLTHQTLAPPQAAALVEAVTRYAHALLRHIDAENSVLLPESEERLRRVGVLELPDRPLADEEREARDGAAGLLERHPPLHDRSALRGEGCVVCPSLGAGCDGVEREWWTDDEWDDFFDRVG
jgi:hemerythrin-like domain-containing protein